MTVLLALVGWRQEDWKLEFVLGYVANLWLLETLSQNKMKQKTVIRASRSLFFLRESPYILLLGTGSAPGVGAGEMRRVRICVMSEGWLQRGAGKGGVVICRWDGDWGVGCVVMAGWRNSGAHPGLQQVAIRWRPSDGRRAYTRWGGARSSGVR